MRKKKDELCESAGVTLQDYVIPAKLKAFCERYKPLDRWREDCEVFTDARLRTYFKAVVTPLGDPLSLYLEDLGTFGFKMHDDESGEPVIYAVPKV